MDQLTLRVVTRGLSHIDLVIHPVNHIEVIGAEIPVDQRLRFAAVWIDLVKLARRTFQPLFDLRARDFHHYQRIGIKIKVGGVTEGQRAFLHFGVARWVVFTSARFKRCSSGEHRQSAQIRIALNKVLHVGALCIIDDLHCWVVLHQRQIAVHHIGGFADGLRHKLPRRAVIVSEHFHQRRIFRRQRFLRGDIINWPRLRFAAAYLPVSILIAQHQIDHAQVIAPHAWHHRRNAVQRAVSDVRPLNGGELFTGEDRMCMAKQDGVDAFHLAEIVNRVLRHRVIRLAAQAGVRDSDNQIGTLCAHLRHITACRFGDVIDPHLALQIRFVPHHDLRRHKADIANFQSLLFAVAINHRGGFDDVGGKKRLAALHVNHVGIHIRKAGACQRFFQVGQAIIEFMITEVADAVIQRIERLIDRMNLALT